ncbi:YdcF family protein [Deltaproteobacteria bacterium OttesenSCG-928-K17]|nr:YdcF family protein [Deltaproteobacteria bacterium OttesenSCG-928-K17]
MNKIMPLSRFGVCGEGLLPYLKALKPVLKCGVFFLALIVGAASLIVWLGSREILIEAEVAVILGNEVYRNGQPAPRLAARLDKGLELYRAGRVKTLIVSGGVGLSGVDEASAMAAYLMAKGVPAQALVIDSQGVNTWQTAVFTAGYLKKHNQSGAIVVSQHFHVPRSTMAFKAAGCERVGQASPDYWEKLDIYSVPREIPALIVYWWKYCNKI